MSRMFHAKQRAILSSLLGKKKLSPNRKQQHRQSLKSNAPDVQHRSSSVLSSAVHGVGCENVQSVLQCSSVSHRRGGRRGFGVCSLAQLEAGVLEAEQEVTNAQRKKINKVLSAWRRWQDVLVGNHTPNYLTPHGTVTLTEVLCPFYCHTYFPYLSYEYGTVTLKEVSCSFYCHTYFPSLSYESERESFFLYAA